MEINPYPKLVILRDKLIRLWLEISIIYRQIQ
nr:MAG TPA: hypothetical protein [Caudoviricetes sp.]DAS32668.1 MAG TPA: hypothetical protein [Caudoviricetes sp.]